MRGLLGRGRGALEDLREGTAIWNCYLGYIEQCLLLRTKGIATGSKDATRGSWP